MFLYLVSNRTTNLPINKKRLQNVASQLSARMLIHFLRTVHISLHEQSKSLLCGFLLKYLISRA